jgi:hypothetical protein
MKATEAKVSRFSKEILSVRNSYLPTHLLVDRKGVPTAVG